MSWILIIIGLLLVIIGGFSKYQQLCSDNVSLVNKKEDEIDEKNYRKLKETDIELDKILASINQKEKMIKEKLNSILELENTLESSLKEKTVEENVKISNSDFKKILNKKYQSENNDTDKDINAEDTSNNSGTNNRKYNLVRNFAKQGMNAEEIAEKLSLGIRETRLILKLYRKEEDFIV